MEYWKPRTKTELIRWLKRHYPTGQFSGMDKTQLYAIYYKIIKEIK